MNKDYRYQLESKRLTGRQPRKLSCPHCGRRKCLVRYVDTRNALVMALLRPEHLRLATAGSGGLSADKVACLRGRRVMLFPDSGCYDKWARQMQLTTGVDYYVSPRLEAYPPNTDLCDLLLK